MNILGCITHFMDMAIPCQSHAQFLAACGDYLIEQSEGTKNHAFASTITIGNVRYGRLSAKTQYEHMKNAIKRHIAYHDPKKKYYYAFEYQRNGNLHAHGWELGSSQQRFIESFSHFGRRNSHDASYQNLANARSYWDYINKENAFPPITNIMKKDVKHIIKGKVPGGSLDPPALCRALQPSLSRGAGRRRAQSPERAIVINRIDNAKHKNEFTLNFD